MEITADLHSHSGYAGGAGQIKLEDISAAMKHKGIEIFGTGDCLLPQRLDELKVSLTEQEEGLFSLPNDTSRFMLQTEVILTVSLDGHNNRTVAHHILLIPGFSTAYKIIEYFKRFDIKNTIGRPFIKSENLAMQEDFLHGLQQIDPMIEIIPAHVMTPDGIYGSKNSLNNIREFYGSFTDNIRIIETGLSADPPMLEKIPDLAQLTYISNSDCHSSALHRIGREFTIIESAEKSYTSILNSLRAGSTVLTAEFNPAEGRYFESGHRPDRHESREFFIGSSDDMLCPVCGKKLNTGVKERALQLSDNSVKPKARNFQHLIPLTEIIAHAKGIKNPASKTVINEYMKLMKAFNSEIELIRCSNFTDKAPSDVDEKIISAINSVREGKFAFNPPGYDGTYGELEIFS